MAVSLNAGDVLRFNFNDPMPHDVVFGNSGSSAFPAISRLSPFCDGL
jgi:plastocyanin